MNSCFLTESFVTGFHHEHGPLPPQPDDDQDPSLDPDPALLQEIADAPTGMRDKDLRTMKDALLIETVQLLGVRAEDGGRGRGSL